MLNNNFKIIQNNNSANFQTISSIKNDQTSTNSNNLNNNNIKLSQYGSITNNIKKPTISLNKNKLINTSKQKAVLLPVGNFKITQGLINKTSNELHCNNSISSSSDNQTNSSNSSKTNSSLSIRKKNKNMYVNGSLIVKKQIYSKSIYFKNKYTSIHNYDDNFLFNVSQNKNYNFKINNNNMMTINKSGIVINGVLTNNSDQQLKHDIKNLDKSYTIDNLRPVSYIYNNTNKKELGFIAQEVKQYLPNIVTKNNEYYSVNYIALIPILVKEIKDLKLILNYLKWFGLLNLLYIFCNKLF